MAKNERLTPEIAGEQEQAAAEFRATGKPDRVFKEFWYRTRRVIAKAEPLDKSVNLRFVLTSLASEAWPAQLFYEQLSCARGEVEDVEPGVHHPVGGRPTDANRGRPGGWRGVVARKQDDDNMSTKEHAQRTGL